MEVPITQFRREIFSLANQALDGAEVWFTHKGRRLKIVPEGKPVNRLSRITPMEVMADPNFDMNDPAFKAEWLAGMEKEWEADWDRDFGPAPNRPTAGMSPASIISGMESSRSLSMHCA